MLAHMRVAGYGLSGVWEAVSYSGEFSKGRVNRKWKVLTLKVNLYSRFTGERVLLPRSSLQSSHYTTLLLIHNYHHLFLPVLRAEI